MGEWEFEWLTFLLEILKNACQLSYKIIGKHQKKKKTLEPILNPKHNLLKCVKIELVTFKTCKISFDCKETWNIR